MSETMALPIMPPNATLAVLEALYASLPKLACQRKCQLTCAVIVMSKLEWERISATLGTYPQGTRNLVCPLFRGDGCTVHPLRPMVCRLYGLVNTPEMRCKWGCIPERWLTEEECYTWLNVVEVVSQLEYPGIGPTAWAQGLAYDEVMPYILAAQASGEARHPYEEQG